jgi:hypothetical protein
LYTEVKNTTNDTLTFGYGMTTLIIIYTVMGPTVTLCIVAIAMAYVSSIVVTLYKAELSDVTLSQDIKLINRAFNTGNTTMPKRTQPSKRQFNIPSMLRGLVSKTLLVAKPPAQATIATAWQTMRIVSAVGNIHAGSTVTERGIQKTKVLEITMNGGLCTYALANLLPPAEFEFHVFDTESTTHQATGYPNVHIANTINQAPTFDVIFAIEAVNTVDSIKLMRDFMATVSKSLSPHGRLILIDSFRSETFTAAPADQQLAMRLAEHAAGVKELHSMSIWIECAHRGGLRLYGLEDLTVQAMPFWTMGWRVSHSIILHTPAWLLRRLLFTRATDGLLFFATAAHAMRNRTAGVYGVVEFAKIGE